MDTKNLSSRQVHWAQKLSRYHFRINYQQGKANGATGALSQYSQRSDEEKKTSEPRIQRFYTNCNLYYHEFQGWTFRDWKTSSPPYTKSLSVEELFYHSCVSSKTLSMVLELTKAPILQASET